MKATTCSLIPERVMQRMDELLMETQQDGLERALVFNRSGRILTEARGDAHSVQVNIRQPGLTSWHSHPTQGPQPSARDIVFFLSTGQRGACISSARQDRTVCYDIAPSGKQWGKAYQDITNLDDAIETWRERNHISGFDRSVGLKLLKRECRLAGTLKTLWKNQVPECNLRRRNVGK